MDEWPGISYQELNDLQMRDLDQEKRKAILAEMSELVINEDHSNPYLFWANHHHAVNTQDPELPHDDPGQSLGAPLVRPFLLGDSEI